MIIIPVNTPTTNYIIGMTSDLKYVEHCLRQIAEVATEDKIIVVKSILPVRTDLFPKNRTFKIRVFGHNY